MDTTKTKIKNKNYKNLMPNTNSSTIKVQKRDGRLEDLDINKIHFVVEEACEGLSGVSSSQIEMNANIQFYDGMTTKDIQNVLVRSANDLISLETVKQREINLENTYKAIKETRKKLNKNKTLIGFCGGPWTVAG